MAEERWGDELDWCNRHGGFHLRNEEGGIAVITEAEDAYELARRLNAADALAAAVDIARLKLGARGGYSLDSQRMKLVHEAEDILTTTLAEYQEVRGRS